MNLKTVGIGILVPRVSGDESLNSAKENSVNLKIVEVGMLVLSPETRMTEWTGEDQKLAHRLVKRGVLVADPADPNLFRCTKEGTAAVRELFKPHG